MRGVSSDEVPRGEAEKTGLVLLDSSAWTSVRARHNEGLADGGTFMGKLRHLKRSSVQR